MQKQTISPTTLISCALIFLLSIFLRSRLDIGGDTGFYLSLGEKIANGGKYYYDFFESNFPLSFYFYAFEYKLANLTGLGQIVVEEIFVNGLGLLTIFYCYKILQRAKFEDNKYRDIFLICIAAGFFLRIQALTMNEFGTKSTLLMLVLFPYFCYSFLDKKDLTRFDMICRGFLIAVMPCLKPNYIIFPLIIEIYKFWKEKSWKFFFRSDFLTAYLLMALYLLFMVKITPEFIEFMIPMWSEFYPPYASGKLFFTNTVLNLINKILPFALVAPIFVYLKLTKTNKILLLFFLASSLLHISESIASADQEAIFFGFMTIILAKFAFDFFNLKYFKWQEHKFLLTSLILVPLFDFDNSYCAFFNIVKIWWALAPVALIYYLKYKNKFRVNKKIIPFIIAYCGVIILFFCASLQEEHNLANLVSLVSLPIFMIYFEKLHKKLYAQFSVFLIAIVILCSSYLINSYVNSIIDAYKRDSYFSLPSQLSDQMAIEVKNYAPNKEDSFLVLSNWIASQFPLMNYLEKENYFKYAVAFVYDVKNKKVIFDNTNPDRAFVFSYLMDDLKKQLQNPQIKIIFVNNDVDAIRFRDRCHIGFLEYYMLDPNFKKLFLQNFHYQNHILEYKKTKLGPRIKGREEDEFDKLTPSKLRMLHNFEVYVRN